MEIKVSFTPEEVDIIKTVQTKSYCERLGCSNKATCCGCPEQIKNEIIAELTEKLLKLGMLGGN